MITRYREAHVHIAGVLGGIVFKDITLGPISHVNMTIRLEGIVAA
jgi:hypothetical protein